MGKKVWGYKLSFIGNGGGKKEFVRYTPTEMDLHGLKVWYEVGSDDKGKYINITHAASGIKIKELRNCKVAEIAERITQEECDMVKRKEQDTEHEQMICTAMQKMEDIMAYINQFDSVGNFSKQIDGSYPPERIPWDATFKMESGKAVLMI
jgi:hypothetical protein